MHDWVTVLPGDTRDQHASMSYHESQSKKKTAKKKTKKVKCRRNKNSTKEPARRYYNRHVATTIPITTSPPQTKPPKQQQIHSFTTNMSPQFPSIFGESIVGKDDGVCRIVTQNVGCIGVSASANNKIRSAKEWLYQHHVDICGWQEIGIANHKFQRHERLHKRMRNPRRQAMRISTGTNTNDDIDKFQWGGGSSDVV